MSSQTCPTKFSFSVKGYADSEFAPFVDHFLEDLPVDHSDPRSYQVVAETLRSITDPQNHHDVPDSLAGKVSCLKEGLAEHKDLILRKVAAKIDDLAPLTPQGGCFREESLASEYSLCDASMGGGPIFPPFWKL